MFEANQKALEVFWSLDITEDVLLGVHHPFNYPQARSIEAFSRYGLHHFNSVAGRTSSERVNLKHCCRSRTPGDLGDVNTIVAPDTMVLNAIYIIKSIQVCCTRRQACAPAF